MTDARCRALIQAAGVDLNPLSGVVGVYYTVNREADLRRLVLSILCERAVPNDDMDDIENKK